MLKQCELALLFTETSLWMSLNKGMEGKMALAYSEQGKLGSKAINFKLPGVDGKTYELSDFKNSRALVIAFMCNHCPYVQAIDDRMNSLARASLLRGVSWVGINSNDTVKYPSDSFEEMKKRAQAKGFVFPYLLDSTQEVAKAYGAVCTPEFYIYAPQAGQFILKYLGRFDDNWKDESAVKRHELQQALEAILNGQEPDSDQKPAMGCSIKWK